MSAILSASVPITLDGREYTLRYRAHAFILYAEQCGGDLLVDVRRMGEALMAAGAAEGAGVAAICRTVRDVLWAGLAEAQPEIRRDEVGRLFGVADLAAIMPAVAAAIQKTMPETPRPPAAVIATVPPSPRGNGPDYGPTIGTARESPLPSSAA
jgi:hypothetical protein